jgi:Fe-S cluster assembly protein SufD
MLARGINRKTAKELLVFGFFEEVISQIQNEQLAERVRELIQQKFREEEARHQ